MEMSFNKSFPEYESSFHSLRNEFIFFFSFPFIPQWLKCFHSFWNGLTNGNMLKSCRLIRNRLKSFIKSFSQYESSFYSTGIQLLLSTKGSARGGTMRNITDDIEVGLHGGLNAQKTAHARCLAPIHPLGAQGAPQPEITSGKTQSWWHPWCGHLSGLSRLRLVTPMLPCITLQISTMEKDARHMTLTSYVIKLSSMFFVYFH